MTFSDTAFKKMALFIIVTVILVDALALRMVNLSGFAHMRPDERIWVISGLSLLNTGVPRSWTIFEDRYPKTIAQQIDGEVITIVQPFLDHPPIFQLIIGGWAKMLGVHVGDLLPWSSLRLPMVYIAIASIYLTYQLILTLYDTRTAFLTLLALSFLPTHVVSSRIIAAEHLLGLLLILSLLAVRLSTTATSKHAKLFSYSLLGAIALVAPLIKLSGLVIPVAIILLLWLLKKRKAALVITMTMGVSIACFILYGWFYDFETFLRVIAGHTSRQQSFWYFFSLFSAPDVGHYLLRDPLFTLGILGNLMMFIFVPKEESEPYTERRLYFFVPWILFALLYVSVAPAELYGWYKFLTIPFAAIGIGYVWNQLFEKRIEFFVMLVPALLVLVESALVTKANETFELVRKPLIVLLFAPALAFLLHRNWIKTQYYQGWVILVIGASVILEILWSAKILLQG